MNIEQQPEMTMRQQATIVGVFKDRRLADEAIVELAKAGFRSDQIGYAMRYDDAEDDQATAEHEAHVESGASTGAITGLGLGALTGLGVLAGVIPVIGPAIAAGTLGIVLSNAAAGAAIIGFIGALVGAGVPQDEAEYYQDEFEAGRIIITVTAGKRAGQATAILRRHGAYDMTTRDAIMTV